MAKDRKRPARGRRKPPTGKQPADDGTRDVEPEVAPDAGGGEIAPPDNLEGAMPYADEARAAEAGADVPEPGESLTPSGEVVDEEEDFDDFERAPDEVEGDLVPAPAGGARDLDPAVAEEALGRPRRKRGRVLTFLGHSVDELRRVQWPNRRQVGQATAVVLGFVVLAGGYLGLMDAIWRPIVDKLI